MPRPSPRQVKVVKVATFAGFLLFSILVGSWWELHPNPPTRWDGDPHDTSIKSLDIYRDELEGMVITLTTDALDVMYNETTDLLTFYVEDSYFGIRFPVVFHNWTENFTSRGYRIYNNSHVTIKGTCRIASVGSIAGIDLHLLDPGQVYTLSIIGLVIVVVVLLLNFRIDLKRILLVGRTNARAQRGERNLKEDDT